MSEGANKETKTPVLKSSNYEIDHVSRLGREIKISPKANITINKPGFRTQFFTETAVLLIGIGKDHTAQLIMSKEALEALKRGEEIEITTTKEFVKNFIQ